MKEAAFGTLEAFVIAVESIPLGEFGNEDFEGFASILLSDNFSGQASCAAVDPIESFIKTDLRIEIAS